MWRRRVPNAQRQRLLAFWSLSQCTSWAWLPLTAINAMTVPAAHAAATSTHLLLLFLLLVPGVYGVALVYLARAGARVLGPLAAAPGTLEASLAVALQSYALQVLQHAGHHAQHACECSCSTMRALKLTGWRAVAAVLQEQWWGKQVGLHYVAPRLQYGCCCCLQHC
jgi:hypothetical protein